MNTWYFVFTSPRSRRRFWSGETVSAVPSRASLLTLYTHGIPPDFPGGVHLYRHNRLRYFQHAYFILIVGVGKDRYKLVDPWRAGELSAVNAIDTLLRAPINSRLTGWRMAVQIITRHRRENRENSVRSTRFGLSMENEQTDAGRDSRTRLARPNTQGRTETGKYSFSLSS